MRIIFIALGLTTMLTTFTAQAEDGNDQSTIKICNQALQEGDTSKAISISNQLIDTNKNNRDAYLCKGRALGQNKQLIESIEALKQADILSKTPREHMVAFTLMGNVYRNEKHYDEAIDSYSKSMEFAKLDNDKRFQSIDLNLIGDVKKDNNLFEEALSNYLSSETLASNDNERADCYERIAATYSLLGKNDQAIEYQIKAQIMQERSGDLTHQANAGLEMGRIYTVAKEYMKAEKSINQVLSLSKEQGGAYWEAKSYLYLGILQKSQGKIDEAKISFELARQRSRQIGEVELDQRVTQELENIR